MLCLLLCYGTTCLVQSSHHILWASSPFPLGFVPSSLSIASGLVLVSPPPRGPLRYDPAMPGAPSTYRGKAGLDRRVPQGFASRREGGVRHSNLHRRPNLAASGVERRLSFPLGHVLPCCDPRGRSEDARDVGEDARRRGGNEKDATHA